MMNEVECPACGSSNTSKISLVVKGKNVRRCQHCKADFLRDGDLLEYFDPDRFERPDPEPVSWQQKH